MRSKMILIKKLALMMCFLAVTACSGINSATVGKLEFENGTLHSGQIISIEQTKLNAKFSKRLSGAVLGHFIAVGLGANSALQFVSAMSGIAITNKEHGRLVDLIEVQSADGKRYKTFVPNDYFSSNEQVSFTAKKSTIYSIARIEG
jgi:outer membrane lipoprotein SlyB